MDNRIPTSAESNTSVDSNQIASAWNLTSEQRGARKKRGGNRCSEQNGISKVALFGGSPCLRHQHMHMYGAYNHAIAGVMLGELYGMADRSQQARIRAAISKALQYSREQQRRRKRYADDHGGWRYLRQSGNNDSDLSLTAWNLMFLRSARNAEFDVPQQHVDEAMAYIHRCFDEREQTFVYALRGSRRYVSRGMVGAGVVALSLGGEHKSRMAQSGGRWILAHSFDRYNGHGTHVEDRYHYSAFCCSQAMFQLGGEYWRRFYPRLAQTFVTHQIANGSWGPEPQQDAMFGNSYTTALAVLSFTPPYQLLPIYQR